MNHIQKKYWGHELNSHPGGLFVLGSFSKKNTLFRFKLTSKYGPSLTLPPPTYKFSGLKATQIIFVAPYMFENKKNIYLN